MRSFAPSTFPEEMAWVAWPAMPSMWLASRLANHWKCWFPVPSQTVTTSSIASRVLYSPRSLQAASSVLRAEQRGALLGDLALRGLAVLPEQRLARERWHALASLGRLGGLLVALSFEPRLLVLAHGGHRLVVEALDDAEAIGRDPQVGAPLREALAEVRVRVAGHRLDPGHPPEPDVLHEVVDDLLLLPCLAHGARPVDEGVVEALFEHDCVAAGGKRGGADLVLGEARKQGRHGQMARRGRERGIARSASFF